MKTSPRTIAGWEAGSVPSCDELPAALVILGARLEDVTREEVRYFGGAA